MSYNIKSITKYVFLVSPSSKTGGRKCTKLVKNSFFQKVFETVLFGKVIPVQKTFNGFDSYTFTPTFSERFKMQTTYAEGKA